MSSPAGVPCNAFRAHSSRPEKCRNCLGNKSSHSATVMEPTTLARTPTIAGHQRSTDSDQPQDASETKKVQDGETPRDSSSPDGGCTECSKRQDELDKLRLELKQWQDKYSLAEESNRRFQDEISSLQHEMDEMHDSFKDEESEQFEQLKQELDSAIKNCKILQIRLNKSERQYSQLDQVKSLLERQLEERNKFQNIMDSNNQTNNEYGHQTQQQQQQPANLFVQLDGETIKLSTREYDQLLRDLNDTIEREKDLQEQIKYSQEEAQLKGERLQAVELENEVLLNKINKLTLANSRLRSSSSSNAGEPYERTGGRELIEQNEQLKLGLEVAQTECNRLKSKTNELHSLLEFKETELRQLTTKLADGQDKSRESRQQDDPSSSSSPPAQQTNPNHWQQKLELECRQLRARLVHSERERRQLKAQLELFSVKDSAVTSATNQRQRACLSSSLRSQSVELGAQETTKCHPRSRCQQTIGRLEVENESLKNKLTERESRSQSKLIRSKSNGSVDQEDLPSQTSGTPPNEMESDLLEKLKSRLDSSESELAKAKSRLVELDVECSRAQRQYKRLLGSLETCGSGEMQLARRASKLPPESKRDSMNRQELRQALGELENELEELVEIIRAKDCLIMEQQEIHAKQLVANNQQQSGCSSNNTSEEQLKSLRRLIEQERLLSNNLKVDVANLEQGKFQLETQKLMLDRKCSAMEEELDKLRQLNGEFRAELEDQQRDKMLSQRRARDLSETIERLQVELAQVRDSRQQATSTRTTTSEQPKDGGGGGGGGGPATELLFMARDLSELKVKNGFLMRQLELASVDTTRQLDELKQSHEFQVKRAIELAQLELKEQHLAREQQLRDEMNELKQRLQAAQRQLARQEEEAGLERDKVRALERDWRRDKSQWQQLKEQLESQLTIERRQCEFKLKESEAAGRDKERALLSMQEKCVQLERDLKRLTNKYSLMEEDHEARLKGALRELDAKSRELNELQLRTRQQEGDLYEQCRRLTQDKLILGETFESMRKSYDEKLAELKVLKETSQRRQEQAYRERQQHLERLDSLSRRLNELNEHEIQARLLKQRLEIQERQLEAARRDLSQAREERAKLKQRCDELEKRELITKTSTISGAGATGSFLKSFTSAASRSSPLNNNSAKVGGPPSQQQQQLKSATQQGGEHEQTIQRLSGKINDQRNLILMLKQQLNETQLELKQLKLIQSSERSKWQSKCSMLTSRLNECEEKLTFETGLLAESGPLFAQFARPKLESNWSMERKATSELIQQQQAQIDSLARDLKKVSQAHDLLRLQSKQLESHNNKLSRKLIEYQQQQHHFCAASNNRPSSSVDRPEEDESSTSKGTKKLTRELKPLVEIVAKIVASLDAPEQPQQRQLQQLRPSSPSDSTDRPLRAPLNLSSDTANARTAPDLISTSLPAHQLVAQQQHHQSRLARLLVGSKSSGQQQQQLLLQTDEGPQASTPANKKSVKRVRIKCSSLGITTAEKKELKMHLKNICEKLDGDSSRTTRDTPVQSAAGRSQQVRAGSEPTTTTSGHAAPRPAGAANYKTGAADQWQAPDSELESERSWSAEPTQSREHFNSRSVAQSDAYRRFPQATPTSTSGLASLTDYESESSLASDYCGPFSTSRGGGAESDSGLTTGTAGSPSVVGHHRKRPKGFRSRLTSTLRNISRSITGLGSDSELAGSGQACSGSGHVRFSIKDNNANGNDDGRGDNDDDGDTTAGPVEIKEIRV